MNLDGESRKDLHLLFTTTTNEITFAKKQQWQLTYYALILMAAITYFKANYQLASFFDEILIIAIAAFAILVLWNIEGDIVRYRKRVKEIRSLLSKEFKDNFELESNYDKRGYKIGYFLILTVTLAVAAILLLLVPPIITN